MRMAHATSTLLEPVRLTELRPAHHAGMLTVEEDGEPAAEIVPLVPVQRGYFQFAIDSPKTLKNRSGDGDDHGVFQRQATFDARPQKNESKRMQIRAVLSG
jgi:hypothetical protein